MFLVTCAINVPTSAMKRLKGGDVVLPPSQPIISKTVPSAIEMELTFLAREIPKEIVGVTPQFMMDTYIPDMGHAELRVRQKGNKFEITKKTPIFGGDGSTKIMKEMTIPLTKSEFEALSSSGKRKVSKYRYNVTIDGFPAEVDIFQGSLKGLVMIDFEFSDMSKRHAFKVPPVCLADVTREIFKAGGVLAGKSYSDIESDLSRFNYKPLF